MVKNKKGGGRHKKMASKHAKMPTKSFKLRLPGAEGELIAHVTKLYGYGHLNVLCNDGVERLCVIRKKFKGRNRRDNQITLHSYILVGIRSYEVVMRGKKPKCDLLYVYSRDQQKQLNQGAHIHNRLQQNTDDEDKQPCAYNLSNTIVSNDKDNNEENWLEEVFDDI
jgi:initiation factor 1A